MDVLECHSLMRMFGADGVTQKAVLVEDTDLRNIEGIVADGDGRADARSQSRAHEPHLLKADAIAAHGAGFARQTRDDSGTLMTRVEGCVELAQHPERIFPDSRHRDLIQLLIIDEAERLSAQGLEHVRDIFDRTGISVIFIGMPGLERRLERYPQFCSRIGFAHHCRQLKGCELTFVLTGPLRQLGLQLDDADFTDHQAIASIARITGGNFRLLHRLFVQIQRILKINVLSLVTGAT